MDNLISRRILTYGDLAKARVGASVELLIDARHYSPSIIAHYAKPDMLPYTDETILVRDSAARKLAAINEALQRKNLRLKIVYGYRHPEVQERYFYRQRSILQRDNAELDNDSLDRLTHNFVAVPDVAGHPTGGAVDLTMIDTEGRELDMGTAIADFNEIEKIKTFTSEISKEQANRRILLHDAMVAQGLAPFYGEWWHFSYGDREWASFYNKKEALFGPIRLD